MTDNTCDAKSAHEANLLLAVPCYAQITWFNGSSHIDPLLVAYRHVSKLKIRVAKDTLNTYIDWARNSHVKYHILLCISTAQHNNCVYIHLRNLHFGKGKPIIASPYWY